MYWHSVILDITFSFFQGGYFDIFRALLCRAVQNKVRPCLPPNGVYSLCSSSVLKWWRTDYNILFHYMLFSLFAPYSVVLNRNSHQTNHQCNHSSKVTNVEDLSVLLLLLFVHHYPNVCVVPRWKKITQLLCSSVNLDRQQTKSVGFSNVAIMTTDYDKIIASVFWLSTKYLC